MFSSTLPLNNVRLRTYLDSIDLPNTKKENNRIDFVRPYSMHGFFAPISPEKRIAWRQEVQDGIKKTKQDAKSNFVLSQTQLVSDLQQFFTLRALRGPTGLLNKTTGMPSGVSEITLSYLTANKLS